MSTVPDWLTAACEEIAGDPNCCDISSSDPAAMAEIIAKHLPFKPDSVYMPVPRCDQCRFWVRQGGLDSCGDCWLFGEDDSPDESRPVVTNKPYPKAAASPFGFADSPQFVTAADFGCVQWEKRDE